MSHGQGNPQLKLTKGNDDPNVMKQEPADPDLKDFPDIDFTINDLIWQGESYGEFRSVR